MKVYTSKRVQSKGQLLSHRAMTRCYERTKNSDVLKQQEEYSTKRATETASEDHARIFRKSKQKKNS